MKITQKSRIGAYQLFLAADTVVSFAMGLFAPFWVVFIQDFGDSMSVFGFALGLKMSAFALAACFGGKLSDRYGRRIVIVSGRVASALIICSYLWATSLSQLYLLQVCFGVAAAIDATATTAFLGDITKRASRGRDIGRFTAVTGIIGAVAMMAGGIAVDTFGMEIIFYGVGALFFASSLLLLCIEEKREAR